MSYLVLARKLRPKSFEEVVGQESVVRTLKNAIAQGRIAHAMLFSGVRGVGKTTLARLMAKAMNCRGTGAPPCNKCESCLEIMAGSAVDLHEIDGASNRGIQEIRELKENIRFQPAQATHKIIIIDEVHMLTNEAFNALLKTLEEPPEHVYFMFATTEVHKVPVTILSRCQRFELKRVAARELTTFFGRICADEGVEIEDAALATIVREAGGSVRDGLSLLDQIISFGGNKISREQVGEVLGLVDGGVYQRLARFLLEGDLAAALEVLTDSYRQGVSLSRFTADLLVYFRGMVVSRVGGGSTELLDLPDLERAGLEELAAGYSVETLVKNFHLLLKAAEELRHSSQPKMVLEVAFMKMISLGDVVDAATLMERLLNLPGGAESSPLPREGGLRPPAREAGKAPALVPSVDGSKKGTAAPPTPKKAVNKASSKEDDAGREGRTPSNTAQRAGKEAAQEVVKKAAKEPQDTPASLPPEKKAPCGQAAAPQTVPTLKGRDVRRDWDGFLAHVKERKPWMSHALSLSHTVRQDGDRLLIKFNNLSDCKILQGSANIKLLNEFALDFFQKDLKVSVVVKSGDPLSGDEDQEHSPQEERRSLGADPIVLLTTEVLGGQISGIRTGPRSR